MNVFQYKEKGFKYDKKYNNHNSCILYPFILVEIELDDYEDDILIADKIFEEIMGIKDVRKSLFAVSFPPSFTFEISEKKNLLIPFVLHLFLLFENFYLTLLNFSLKFSS